MKSRRIINASRGGNTRGAMRSQANQQRIPAELELFGPYDAEATALIPQVASRYLAATGARDAR
jgi:hypothetical protein